MSHSRERKEKNCLNCGTMVQGRFCHVCGQENLEPNESFWHLVNHFFSDITHFDGKFFSTLKDLMRKPGFLSSEYMKGRRASYLNPVRMYVFTSAIFFLLFFSFLYKDNPDSVMKISSINGKSPAEIDKLSPDSFAAFTANINKEDGKPAVPMTRQEFERYKDTVTFQFGFHIVTGNRVFTSKEQYDSALAAGEINQGWILRQLAYKEIAFNNKYNNDPRQIASAITHAIIHSLPQILFISLPFLALLLKLLYIRRKQFYYVSHGIFSLHLYIFLFIAMLFLFGISKLNSQLHWGLIKFIFTVATIGLFVYEYMAMKNFYRQGWLKTFIKFLLVNSLFLIVLGCIFLIFVLLSIFKI